MTSALTVHNVAPV